MRLVQQLATKTKKQPKHLVGDPLTKGSLLFRKELMSTVQQVRCCYRLIKTYRNFTKGELAFQKAFLKYKDGNLALLATAITALALAALPTYAALFIGGMTLPYAIPATCAAILLSSTLLFGPKVYYEHIPALLKFIADLLRCKIAFFDSTGWRQSRELGYL